LNTESSTTSTPRPLEVALLASVFVVAACGLVYELAAGALASYLLGDSVLQFSTIIGSYLFAMGIGSWLSRFFERQLPAHFLRIELLVALVGGLPCRRTLFMANAYVPGAFRFLLYAMVLLVGTLVGLEIPLVMRILRRNVALKELVSQVLTFDYLGALAVSLAFPLVLVPHLGLIRTGLLFGLMNAAVAVWALWLFRHELRHFNAHVTACLLVMGTLGAGFVGADQITTLAEDHFYQDRVVFTATTPYQRIVVTNGRGGHRLFLNGNLQFAERDEYRYHEALVHPVMSAHGVPKKVAVLGGGDGMAVREVLKYPGVESVTLVELDPAMTKLFSQQPALAAPQRRRAALAQGARRECRCFPVAGQERGDVRRHHRGLPRPDQFLHRQALHQLVLRAARPPSFGQRLCRDPDHLAAGGAPQLLDGGQHAGVGGPENRALPRQCAQLRRMGLCGRQPPAFQPHHAGRRPASGLKFLGHPDPAAAV
jgi:spermidine synthase